jgi:hypothetical protein
MSNRNYKNNGGTKGAGGGGKGARGKGGGGKVNNIYDGCKKTINVMTSVSNQLNIDPADLFEELYYQLPYEWIRIFRKNYYKTIARELENGNLSDYLSDSSYQSSNSSTDSLSEYSDC